MSNPGVNKLLAQINSDMDHIMKEAPMAMGRIVINFMEENFEKGGFQTNEGIDKWAPRKNDEDPGRGILIGKQSGRLMKSGTIFQADEEATIVGVPDNIAIYGKIHNEGGTVNPMVTDKMRKFAWFKFKKTGEDRWKYLAITKKNQLHINIPKRQFLANSSLLGKRISDFLRSSFEKSLRNNTVFK